MTRNARIPTTGQRTSPRRLLGLVAGGLLLVTAGGSLLAQDAKTEAPVDLRRLQFEYRCFFATPEWKGRGEDDFLRRLRAQHAAYEASREGKLADFENLMADALWKRAEFHRAAKDLKSASERAGEILLLKSESGRVGELKPQADELVISWSLAEAKRFETVENSDAQAWDAYATCLGTKNNEALKEVVAGMTRIALRRNDYEKVKAANELAAEGRAIQKILGDLSGKIPAKVLDRGWPDIQALRDRQTQIEESTGHVDISILDVSAVLNRHKGPAATLAADSLLLRFVPVSEGQAWPAGAAPAKAPSSDLLLIRGTYDVQVFAPGSDTPAALWLRVPVGKARFALEIPGRAPEGMVYVGPWQGGGGFFVDRTEVTVGQVQAAAAKDPGLQGLVGVQETAAANLPAWFRDDDQGEAVSSGTAELFAASVGKSIPTLKQWMDAAYGPAPAAYPWGMENPVPAKHYVNGTPEAQPVGSRPAGASPYGCVDMAGNLAEWVVGSGGGLWAIGGSFSGALDAGGHDRLKEPAPGFSAYQKMNGADKDKYLKFKAPFEDYWTTGLRLVIPVK